MAKKYINGPFVVQVHDIVRRPGEMRELAFSVPSPAKWGEGLVAVEQGTPIDLEVRLESVHEGILATVAADTTYDGMCGRCLTELTRPLRIEFHELFGYSGDEASDFEVQDDHVDLETPVRDSIVLALPFQPVCQPDCPGLDPETGERLAPGTVPAQREQIDPRWAALTAYTPDHEDPEHDDAATRVAPDTEKS